MINKIILISEYHSRKEEIILSDAIYCNDYLITSDKIKIEAIKTIIYQAITDTLLIPMKPYHGLWSTEIITVHEVIRESGSLDGLSYLDLDVTGYINELLESDLLLFGENE